MDDRAFDTFTRAAAVVSRRYSLATLGAVGLAAALARPSPAPAAKKAKKRCNKEKKQCRRAIEERCQGNQGCLQNFLPCCESCKVGKGIICVLNQLP